MNSYQSKPCLPFFPPSSLRSLYWPAGFTRCSRLLAALLLFMDLLQFKVNALAVFILQRNFTLLYRQHFNTIADKRTHMLKGPHWAFKNIRASCFINQISCFIEAPNLDSQSCFLALAVSRSCPTFWCVYLRSYEYDVWVLIGSDFFWFFLHFQFGCITGKDLSAVYY